MAFSLPEDPLRSYREWAETELGVVLHPSLRLGPKQDGNAPDASQSRGVFATAAIEDCSVLVTVPFGALLRVEDIGRTPLGTLASTPPGLREDDILALTLLYERHERGRDSRWSRHIAMLPETYHSLPFWTPDDVETLKGTSLYPTARALLEQVPRDFAELHGKQLDPTQPPGAPSIGETYAWFTLEAYRWALGTIWSRFVSVARPGQPAFKCMAPVFDFFNHLPSANVAQGFRTAAHVSDPQEQEFLGEDGAVQILTGQAWPADGEVFLNYGPVGNARMLMLYGCTLGVNPFDGVDVYCTMDPRAPGFVVKQEAFASLGIDTRQRPFRVTMDRLPDTLLGALRIQRADTPADMAPAKLRAALTQNEILGEDNERLVIATVSKALEDMRAPLEASRAADDAAVAAAGEVASEQTVIYDKEAMAASVRGSERRVLDSVLQLLQGYEANLGARLRVGDASPGEGGDVATSAASPAPVASPSASAAANDEA